jgi:hypothetical protein
MAPLMALVRAQSSLVHPDTRDVPVRIRERSRVVVDVV